jgi:hypothetical protein
VTWVVVRSWPSDSTPAQRLADQRFALGSDGEYRVRRPDGQLGAPEPHLAYVFYGDRLTVFPIRMREDDFIGFRSNRLAAYSDVEAFLRRFEPTR